MRFNQDLTMVEMIPDGSEVFVDVMDGQIDCTTIPQPPAPPGPDNEITSSAYVEINFDGPKLSYDFKSGTGDPVLYEAYQAVIEKILNHNLSVGPVSIEIDDIERGDAVINCPGTYSITIVLRAEVAYIPDNDLGDADELSEAVMSLLWFLYEFNMQMGGIFVALTIDEMEG